MSDYYKLTDNTQTIHDIEYRQIIATQDFKDIKKGDLGGWISSESTLVQDGSWIDVDSLMANSTVRKSTVIDSGVSGSIVAGSAVTNSIVHDSIVTGGSRVTDSDVIGSTVKGRTTITNTILINDQEQ